MRKLIALIAAILIGTALVFGAAMIQPLLAQSQPAAGQSLSEIRKDLSRAQRQEQAARRRAEELREAAEAGLADAERANRELASLAGQIQLEEASMAAARTRMALIARQRRIIDGALAEKREPLVRLTAALQRLTARPLSLAALQPGSLKETVYLRAVLDQTVPAIRERTADLRGELERSQALARESEQALAALARSERDLRARRTRLQADLSKRRLASRKASGEARQQTERALELAAEARSLNGLLSQVGASGSQSAALADLPGPIMRPAQPTAQRAASRMAAAARQNGGKARTSAVGPEGYRLPVIGRVTAGFGEQGGSGMRQSGIVIEPNGRAQVVAPAAGRVAFAGPYRGFGQIAIIEHGKGWTSLVTGLEDLDVEVGDTLAAGGPLGRTGTQRPKILLELRRANKPVNPLEYAAAR